MLRDDRGTTILRQQPLPVRPRRKIRSTACVTALALLAMSPFAGRATDYAVKPDGSGNFTTIQACANSVQAGDSCQVYPGVYAEHVKTASGGTSDSNRVTFKAMGAVTMQGFDIRHPYVTVDGFTISGYNSWWSGQVYVTKAANFCQVLNNTIGTPALSGTYGISGIYIYGDDTGPTSCLIQGNTVTGQTYPFLQLYGSSHVVQNNTFQNENGQDFVRIFGSYMTIRRNRFLTGTPQLGAVQHPDFIQMFAAQNDALQTHDNLIEENWIQDLSVYRTDLTAPTSNNVVHSASRVFTAGDISAYIRITGGNGWTPGNYRITSVSGGDATLAKPVGTAPLAGGQWWHDGAQLMELNSSLNGVGPQSSKIYNLTFLRNVFVNVQFSPNIGMPGVQFLNNTFYLVAWSGTGPSWGGSGSRGNCDRAYIANNVFYLVGNGVSTGSAWYSMSGQVLYAEAIAIMATGETAVSHPIATVVFGNLLANGYVNSNGVIQDKARDPALAAAISNFVWTLDSSYSTYKTPTYNALMLTVSQDATARADFHAGHNYVYPTQPTGACDTPYGGGTPYQFSSHQQWCEGIPALNGTDGKFASVSNPLGADGAPFTLDDGLKPVAGSPLCAAGEGGVDIGAYSCDPSKVFSASSTTQSASGGSGVQAPTSLTVVVR